MTTIEGIVNYKQLNNIIEKSLNKLYDYFRHAMSLNGMLAYL